MLSASKSNVQVYVCPSKVAKAAVVTVGVKAKGCYWGLKGLKCGLVQCHDLPYSTALLWAVYKSIRNRMVGNVAEELASQITHLECNYQDGEFLISATCTGSFTAIRKTACSILKLMNTARVYPAYKEALKALSNEGNKLSSDKKIFIGVANAFAKSALDKTCVLISGKALLDADKTKKLAESCAAKCGCESIKGAGSVPAEKSSSVEGFVSLSASGVDAMLVKKYIESSLNVCADAADGAVSVPEHLKGALGKLNNGDRIARYVGGKYSKIKDGLAAALVFAAALNGVGSTKELHSYCNKKVSAADLIKSITASFKGFK